MADGFLLIHKPLGLRCTDLVRKVSKIFPSNKVGHGGTLDSTASGLVVVMVGKATRFCEATMGWRKVYRAQVQFGWFTTTDDSSGERLGQCRQVDHLTVDHIRRGLLAQMGHVRQQPPQISALKVGGVAAHVKSRAGNIVSYAPRYVDNVFFSSVRQVAPGCFEFDVWCHRGGYIRSVARILGENLGVGAHLKSLLRIKLGAFDLEQAISVDQLNSDVPLRSMDEMALVLPHVYADRSVGKRLSSGLPQWFDDRLNRCQIPDSGLWGSEPFVVISPEWLSLCKLEKHEQRWVLRPIANLLREGEP